MKQRTIYSNREVRSRTGTLVLVIPKPLARELGFKIRRKTESEQSCVLNSENEIARVYLWLDLNYNIEIHDAAKPLQNINGIISECELHPHGDSFEFTIPYDIRNTYEWLGVSLDKVDVTKNEHEHIVVIPKSKPQLNNYVKVT